MSKKMLITLFSCFFALVAGSGLCQAEVSCEGKVNGLFVADWGGVYVKLGNNDFVRICDVDEKYQDVVPPSVCESWKSLLLAAELAGKDVIIRWTDNYDCNNLPKNSVVNAPDWVHLRP